MDTVCVAIPTLPTRQGMLGRAMASVCAQDHPVADVAVAVDLEREGAWVARNRAATMACHSGAHWVAFLDDDDELLPCHCSTLLRAAEDAQADVVWGWFTVAGGADPFPHYRGRQYDAAQPHIVPITYMVRAQLLHQALRDMGGFQPDGIGAWDNQDQPLLDYYHREGRMLAVEDTTWRWYHHGTNTSGLPTRGR